MSIVYLQTLQQNQKLFRLVKSGNSTRPLELEEGIIHSVVQDNFVGESNWQLILMQVPSRKELYCGRLAYKSTMIHGSVSIRLLYAHFFRSPQLRLIRICIARTRTKNFGKQGTFIAMTFLKFKNRRAFFDILIKNYPVFWLNSAFRISPSYC